MNVFIDDELVPGVTGFKFSLTSWGVEPNDLGNDVSGSLFFSEEISFNQIKDAYFGKILTLRIEDAPEHIYNCKVRFFHIEQSASSKTDWEPTTELCFSEWPDFTEEEVSA